MTLVSGIKSYTLENKDRMLSGWIVLPLSGIEGWDSVLINVNSLSSPQLYVITGNVSVLILPSDMQQHECAMSWKAHDGEVYSVEFSYDENTVYSIGEDGKVSSK